MADPIEAPAVADEVDAAPEEGRAGTDEVWWTAPDGTPFPTPEDLNKHWSTMLPKSEYTKKTQALADDRRLFDTERSRFDLDRQEHQRMYDAMQAKQKEFEKFDRFIKERPALYQRLLQEIQQGPSADDTTGRLQAMFDEKYGSQIKELSDWKSQREAADAEKEAFDKLASEYEDFDGEAVRNGITELTAKLQSGDFHYLAETVLLAVAARAALSSPEQIQPAPSEDEPPAPTPRVMPGSGSAPPTSTKAARSIEEAAARAHRELG